jgi:glycosyltransferase involved in cell wall biosynthesis
MTTPPTSAHEDRAGVDSVVAHSTHLVDVGIPTVGRCDMLVQAVESVLSQSFDGWRLVISENGAASPEVASALAGYLADPRIELRSTGHRVSAAMNHTILINAGTAPYVAILHDDDLWAPTFLERRVRFLKRHPDCGWVFSGTMQIDQNGEDLGPVKRVLREGVHAPEEFAPILLDPRAAGTLLPAPTVELVRRSAYEAAGAAFDESFPLTFDSEMLGRLAVRFPVGYLAGADAFYRLHASQTSFHQHWGDEMVRRQTSLEARVRRSLPQVDLDSRKLARHRADVCLIAAMDAAEDGDRRRALACLRRSARARPRSLANPRAPATLLALISGRPGRRLLARARAKVFEWHMRRRSARKGGNSPWLR